MLPTGTPLVSDKLDWSKSFMYSLHETYFLIEKRLEKTLGESDGITFSQFLILLPLHCTPNASQSHIADFLHLTEATVSRHITGMEKDGFLLKKEAIGNRRKHVLSLTNKGEKAFKKAHGTIEDELKKIFAVIEEGDRKKVSQIFHVLLKKLIV